MKNIYAFLLLACLFFSTNTIGQIFINEWVASNSSGITDPDFEETSDWVEIYNHHNFNVNLSGYFLTDNLDNPDKWTFPNNTQIGPKAFLLIWADGLETGIHSSFKLAKDGESIGLFNSDTILIDSVIFANQATNISMGRKTDGGPELKFFTEPTPGKSNTTQAFDGITNYRPKFSIKGGFYDQSITVTMSSIDGEIRYTTDGSAPSIGSSKYTNPIVISKTTNLRASVFEPNFIPGKPTTHTYFFNENSVEGALPVVSISTKPDHFWDEEIGLYVQDFKPEWEYPINIELFENDGSDRAAFNELAGVRVNGLYSWQLPQKMLGIYFDNDYDNNNLDYNLFFDRNRKSFDSFILRASGSDWVSTMFRDGLCQQLSAETMGMEVSGFRPAITYVNGEYMGIHNLRSRTDESFIEENFGLAGNEYDLIENYGVVENGDTIEFQKLMNLFTKDLTIQTNFDAVENEIDLNNFTDFFISEMWASNSSYGHNIKAWKAKKPGAKWRWILVDFDRGFLGFGDNLIHYFTESNNPEWYSWVRTIFRNMLKNEAYSYHFSSRFTDHLYTTFHPEKVTKQILANKKAIEKEIPNHIKRWEGTSSSAYGDAILNYDFWEAEVAGLNSFARQRGQFVYDDLKNQFDLEDLAQLGMMTFPKEAGQIEINALKIPDSPWNGFYFKNMPFELTADSKAGYRFEEWKASFYETIIEKESEWKYLDDGSDQGVDWKNLDYDDSSWKAGNGELGFGDGGENTTISFGGNSNNKHITTYFRKKITIQNKEDYSGLLSINLLRDDGAIVYLNGEELFRTNISEGEILFDTYASVGASGESERNYFPFSINTDQLQNGENVIAVEIHQVAATSSDLSFDLELKALNFSGGAQLSTNKTLNVNLNSDTFLIAIYEPTGECFAPKNVEQNTSLKIDCSPYLANESITIAENATLTIEPGVEIHFAENTNLIVNGSLKVMGTEDEPVKFKAIEGQSSWGNVSFKPSQDTSRLNWLEISNASGGQHPIYEDAAISGFHSNIEMNHLKIEEVERNPILTRYSNVSLKNSQLHSKVTGDLINVKYGTSVIENCDFRGNDQIDTDAIDYDEVKNGIIKNSKIYNFFGFNSDGIDLGEESKDVLIENNFIHNCSDKGISIGQLSNILLKNNTIVNCNQGVAIKDLSNAEIDQTTFYNTGIPIACFEKNIGKGGGMAFVTNSILSNSNDAVYFSDETSSINFSNTLSDTESIPGADNLFANPVFYAPTQNNFTLYSTSPAILAGIDDAGNPTDLGTKFHDFSVPASLLISAINYHPLDEESEFVKIYNPSSEIIDLEGYIFSKAFDFTFPPAQIVPGETIWIAKDASLFPDVSEQIFTWTNGKLSNNSDSIRLTDDNGIVLDQVVYNDGAPWPLDADGLGSFLSLRNLDWDNHFAESWKADGTVSTGNHPFIKESIQIFPNPSTGTFRIKSPSEKIHTIEIFNTFGKKVKHINTNSSFDLAIDLANFSNGIFFLKLNGKGIAEKLVVAN